MKTLHLNNGPHFKTLATVDLHKAVTASRNLVSAMDDPQGKYAEAHTNLNDL